MNHAENKNIWSKMKEKLQYLLLEKGKIQMLLKC